MHAIHLQPTVRRVNPYGGFRTPLDCKLLDAYKKGWELHVLQTLYTSEIWMRNPEGDGSDDILMSKSDQSAKDDAKSVVSVKDFARIGKRADSGEIKASRQTKPMTVWVFDREKAALLEKDWKDVLEAMKIRQEHPRKKSPPNLERLSETAKSLLAKLLPDEGKPASGVYPFKELLPFIKELDRQDLLAMVHAENSVELVVRPEFRKLRLPGVPKLMLLVKEH